MAAILTLSFLIPLLLMSSSPLPVSSDLPPSYPICNKDDEKALLTLRDSMGSSTNPFPSWDPSIPCCEWDGVVCNETTGRLYSLDIIQSPLITTIPPVIGNFPTLQVLRLHKLPNLTGTIPPQITKLKLRLRFLTISWAALSGPVPAFLSELHALEQLDLSFNQLSGSIPPELGDLHRCYAIDISRNNLTGTIPGTLFRNGLGAAALPILILSHNGLTGEIPRSFENVNFVTIDVSRNRLTGDASFLFGPRKALEQIDLSRNQLVFDLSVVEFPLNGLVSVYLDHNMIHGSIPTQIVNVTNFNFNFFNVSYNRLCGKIPTGGPMGQFDASCYIHNKCLCGTPLPPCK